MDKSQYITRINFNIDSNLFGKSLEFPFIHHEQENVFGHINQCKYSLQLGCLSCRCTNPSCPSIHCTFGWHTKGIVPDQFCEWYVLNPNYVSVSVDFHTNQKKMVQSYIDKKLIPQFDINKALSVNNIKEYVHKPYNAFIVGMKEYDESLLKDKYPFIYKYSPNVSIFPIDPDSDYISYINDNHGFEFRPSIFLPFASVSQDTLQTVESNIREVLKHKETNIQTRIRFNRDILHNEIMNIANINSPKSYEILPFATPLPVLCIAGGATLDNYLQLIHDIQDKITIVTIPTVYKTLLSHNIIPDYICFLDMQIHSDKYFNGIPKETMQKSTLIFDIDSNHEVVDMFKGNKIIHISSIGDGHLYDGLVPDEYSKYKKHGTVSVLAYQIALMLKPLEIYLVGYDLCYHTDNPKTHAEGCAFKSNISFVTDNKNNTYIQLGNDVLQTYEKECYNNQVGYVSVSFNHYLNDLEITVNENNIPTYNIGEKCIKKKGVPLLSTDTLLSKIQSLNTKPTLLIHRITPYINNKKIKLLVRNYLNINTFMLTYYYNIYIPMLLLSEDSLRCNPQINSKLLDYIKKSITSFKTDIYTKLEKKLINILKLAK